MKAAAHPHEKPHHPHWPLAILLFGFVFLLGWFSVHDDFTWISVRTGRLILSEGAVPRTDPFSHGAAGAAWTTHSWLGDVLLAKLDKQGGPAAVSLVASAALGLAFALLLPISHGHPVLAAAVLAAGACAAWPGLAPSTRVFDFLFFSLFLRLFRPRRRFRWPDAAFAAGLCALWSNVHGAGAVLALWFAGLKTFKTSLRTGAGERLGYWGLAIGCAIVFAWNPHGYGLFAHALADAQRGAQTWHSPLVSAYGLFMLAGFVSCWYTLQQEFVTTLACTAVMALSVALPGLRPLAVLAACPLITLALGHFVRPRTDTPRRVTIWAACAAALFAGYWAVIHRPLAGLRGYPVRTLEGAARFVRERDLQGRMFNDPDSGAELIGILDRQVFSDHRRGVYPRQFRREAREWRRMFGSLDSIYRFDYAVLRKGAEPGTPLDSAPGWTKAYEDERGLVYVKKKGIVRPR